ncbi:mitochondrial protein from FMP27-domain-containing protein [Plectosphaerella plurivora]|uniref:Mitochondrial protein from FMP27-domain-containing protein n=1 Tax=Plectosphaerella plurivora TaxID=936078 RepID=A0A9P9A532_9PEZI|nr:mitochondrial protein from FMP27-domain-containing protein [Plectosphaerella plurivora]
MALLNPTFVFGVLVLVYLSSFILFAVLRIITGISIQRIGYFSLRRLAYTPKDGIKFEIRGLGLNIHRPTFAQPTWLSIVVNELTITVDVRELHGKPHSDHTNDESAASDEISEASDASAPETPKLPRIRRNGATTQRSETWRHLMKLKDRVKRLHRKIKWLRMVDVVATNSTINIVDVGNIQCGSFTIGVDTRRKMVDRARFFFQFRTDRRKNQRQAEWIMTVRSVLFTAEGGESLEVLDNGTLNIHGFLYDALDGLRDASIGLKLNRVHIPYDDVHLCFQRYKRCQSSVHGSFGLDESPDFFNAKGPRDGEDPALSEQAIMQTVSDSKEFVSSILRGVKEVQFAVSFVGITKKIDSVKPHANPVLLNMSLKEVGVDLHRLDPKSPAHRMYFPSKDIAHEALAAALSISVGLDDGLGKPERLLYIPMTTTTVKTTLPSKTVELTQDGSAEAKNANILFANSVITSPSVDLDPRHLPLLIAMLQSKPKHHRIGHQQSHLLLSRLLPKANIKFTMHEPVVRITLPPVDKSAPDDDFDLIISSISSISLDVESSHSSLDELHYSLASTTRLQSLHLYYQTSGGDRFDLVDAEAFDLRCQLSAAPDVHVVATGSIDTFAIKMVRPEITDGLRQIIRQLRLNVEPKKRSGQKMAQNQNFLRAMPSWLLQFQLQATDVSLEVAGVDEEISDDIRGISLQLDSLTSEYRAQRLEGLQRRPSRRRANSRTMAPDTDLLKAPLSPRKKQQNPGDGRRVTFHVRGLEAYIVEGTDRVEPEPFVNMPRFEVALQALSDQQGPIFHVHAGVRSILCQYSLYRHYCVGVAAMVLRKAFLKTQKDMAPPRPSAQTRSSAAEVDHLAPPMSPEASLDELNDMSTLAPELISIDVKIVMVQVKADLPHDPPMLLQVFGVEAGRHRWSAPFFVSKQIRVCVQPPRIRGVWARMLCIKGGRIDYRISRRKLPSGQFQEERMYDIVADAVRFAIPHEVAFNQISDNLVNVFKATKQLHHRFRTGTNEYILDKLPEGPRNVPKISIRTKAFLFELEDGAFEWKLGMIYKAGRAEQLQRLAREEAFELKRKKIREEESRKESNKNRARSLFHRSRGKNDPSERRRHSVDGRARASEDRGRAPRYDPDGGCYGITGQSKIAEQEARHRLDAYNATSWKRRIDRYCNMSRKGMKDLRGTFWGPDRLPDDLEEAENILEVPQRPSLMSTIVSNFHFQIDKPTFPMRELPDFIHSVGKGMPKDMRYGLLVPMHVSMDVGELRMTLRDYPLPMMHIPGLKAGQNQRTSSMSLRTNFVIAEEYRGIESTRKVKVHITPPRNLDPDGGNEGSFAIDVRRTIGPIKSFSDMRIDINTALPTRITWGGPCYQPAIQDMMMVIESFTKPQVDPSERVGFWDKIRLNFHSRIHIAWRGDGDLHLALKGTRDPYCVTGNGAGFIMCWRNGIKWNINANDDPKRFMTVDSGEYVWAIPDYSHQVREAHRKLEGDESLLSEDDYRRGIQFKKVIMKLSGKVQWMAGMVFERAIEDGKRSFDFKPHYDIVLRSPQHVHQKEGYDAFRGFRSQHIHLSIAVRAPVDRDWMDPNPAPSRSYNAVHCTPRFFTHFFSWWSLFGGPLSLPIRQGRLWPGREKVSKKFGKHLATIKYNLLLAPVFMSHIYKHKDVEDYSENAVSATGLKVRFDSFMLDLHQRREEFNTRDKGRKTSGRTSGMKIHAAQLDLAAADVRAVSASIRGTTTEAIKKGTLANLSTNQAETADPSRFSIPDNDLTWIDMDDFVELDWILPSEPNPDTKILPLAYAPRVTYFRQTDIGGSIAGDPDRTSPFGQEPTHFCIMSKSDDTRQVQAHLVHERLSQLEIQIENHGRNLGEAELLMVRDGGNSPAAQADFEALRRHSGVLHEKKSFLEAMLLQLEKGSPTSSQLLKAVDRDGDSGAEAETMSIPAGAEFESDAQNRFVVHNLHFKWNNLLRNIVLRYIHQVSQRRGFVYYLSRPAVKFILDIVEEQLKARQTNKPFHTQASAANPSPNPSTADTEVQEDIEDKIRKILKDGRKFVNADQDTPVDNTPNVAMDDLTSGISDDFRARNNYHVRVIAPQLQFQSDKNKKNVVLLTAKGMELKIVEVMDRERLSDPVSGLVQRRFLVSMDSTQFFVTHQKWFSTHLVSMYAGSQYGTPVSTSWPPWVPMEVMFDFKTDPFGFKRVVQKTSATLRYDKYNTLRLKYNDEVNSEGANPMSQPATESRVDNLWVEFPQARALCNSAQYYAMYVIVLDLLMYSEPLEKTRSERLEKIMLASDFSDLSGAPEMVQKLQERIRQLEDIKSHFQIYTKYLDQQGWEDRLLVERDLAACEDELFFMMKAITTSQRKYDTNDQSNALLRWSIMAREIVWHLLRDNNEPLVELQLKDVEYDRTDHSDGSHMNLVRVGKVLGLNLLPDAIYPEMIAPYVDPERAPSSDTGENEMIRVYWNMLEAIAGIPIMDQFEVTLFPLKIQLERELGKRLFEYIFPDMTGEKATRNDSPFMLKHNFLEEEEDEADSLTSSTGRLGVPQEKDGFNTRPGSLELRLHPTLTSDAPSPTHTSIKKSFTAGVADSHTFRLFRSGGTGKTALKKASYESLRSSNVPKPGNLGRSSTGASTKDGNSAAGEKKSRFGLRKGDKSDEIDDLTKMMSRASSYMTFAYISMPSVVLCLSYKGKESRNFEDVHDFVFRMPAIEWRNKTWSNLDLALALKKAVIKALISHTGAIIGNKFKLRPNTAQTSKLRELANNSSLIAPAPLAMPQRYAESMNSDDSSSLYGTSPVDYSRSPPRSLHGSSHSSIPVPRSTSRSSSVASSRSYRNASGGSANQHSSAGPPVPSFLMMTPPTPQDTGSPMATRLEPLRPMTSGGLTPYSHSGSTRRPGSSRSSVGSGFLRDKLSALTHRMREGSSSSQKTEEDTMGSEEGNNGTPDSANRAGKRMSWAQSRTKTG